MDISPQDVPITHLSPGKLEVTIVGPSGKLPVDISPQDDLKYSVEYTPDKVGPLLITVKFAGNEVGDILYLRRIFSQSLKCVFGLIYYYFQFIFKIRYHFNCYTFLLLKSAITESILWKC